MSEPTIKQGWLRALIFLPIWFVTMMMVVGGGSVLMMVLSGVDMQNEAAVGEWAMGMESMGFASPIMLGMAVLQIFASFLAIWFMICLLYTSPSPRD